MTGLTDSDNFEQVNVGGKANIRCDSMNPLFNIKT